MQRRTFAAIMLSILLLASAATLIGNSEASADIRASRGGVSGEVHPASTSSARGFYVYYEKSEKYDNYRELLRKSGKMEQVAHELNSYVNPEKAVPIAFKECGEEGAYYDVKTDDITFCYEMVDSFNSVFTYSRGSEAERDSAVVDAAAFILAHEAGHAVLDLNSIPFTGKEEDVADQFGTLVLTRMGEGETAITGGEAFRLLGKRDGQYNLWSEHALDEQRYYNMLCWVYGSDKTAYGDYAGDELPEKRAKGCVREYRNIQNSWEKLLE